MKVSVGAVVVDVVGCHGYNAALMECCKGVGRKCLLGSRLGRLVLIPRSALSLSLSLPPPQPTAHLAQQVTQSCCCEWVAGMLAQDSVRWSQRCRNGVSALCVECKTAMINEPWLFSGEHKELCVCVRVCVCVCTGVATFFFWGERVNNKSLHLPGEVRSKCFRQTQIFGVLSRG